MYILLLPIPPHPLRKYNCPFKVKLLFYDKTIWTASQIMVYPNTS